jgi:hypothetical protein
MNSVFYLKVNRDIDYAYKCIQWWIDVARQSQFKYYIICDNEQVKINIVEKCNIYESAENIFIRSHTKQVEHISVEIADKRWKKASDAHLTTFYHALKNNITSFWNIDADDTFFCLLPDKAAHILSQTQKYAIENGIEIFGLDMWWTIHRGDNWTFGITYTNTEKRDWMQTISLHCKDEAYKKLVKKDDNVDSYFNYLRAAYDLPIESFYIKNVDFIHWGAPFGPLHYCYRDGFVRFPISVLYLVANTLRAGKCQIEDEVISIDAGINSNDAGEYRNKTALKTISSLYGQSPFLFALKNLGWKRIIDLIKTHVN